MKRAILAVAVVMALATALSAAPIDCLLGTGDVLTLNPDGCYLDGLTFDNFVVSDNRPDVVSVIGINGALSGILGNNVILRFTVSPSSPPAGGVDIILGYRVLGGLIGADVQLGSYSGLPAVTETVCAVDPQTPENMGICPAGDVLARLAASHSGPYGVASFPRTNPVWIIKDINIPFESTMSDFANSHAIPEPVTLSLIGAGLFAIGLLRRRLKK